MDAVAPGEHRTQTQDGDGVDGEGVAHVLSQQGDLQDEPKHKFNLYINVIHKPIRSFLTVKHVNVLKNIHNIHLFAT